MYASSRPPQSSTKAKLRTETRKLKRKLKNTEKKHKKEVSQFQDEIKQLQQLAERPPKPSDSLEEIMQYVQQCIPPRCQMLFKSQVRIFKCKSKHGRRWTDQDKVMAISLYYQSPKAYRFLNDSYVFLPHQRTINRWLEGMKFNPGFQNGILDIMQERVGKMSEMEKVCSLLIDEVSLKEALSYNQSDDLLEGLEDFGFLGRTQNIANTALVFMVRGIASNWKQPICYFLARNQTTSDNLTILVKECLQRLYDIGLVVKSCVCDQGSNNRRLFADLGIKIENPFYMCGQEKVYFMYDPPHLLKSVRNNLLNHPITVDGKEANWEHIKQLYLDEQARGHVRTKAAGRLTKEHIFPNGFQKMSVPRAAQVLSASVAASLNTAVGQGTLPPAAAYTAEFCSNMDKLFNSVNGEVLFNEENPIFSVLTEKSGHLEFWQNMKQWIGKFKCQNLTKIHCFDGWILTLTAMEHLWHDLHTLRNFTYLITKHLNQDPLENLFSVIRYRGGSNDNPNSAQFRAALKACTIHHMTYPHEKSNCEDDKGYYLLQILEQCKQNSSQKTTHATSANANPTSAATLSNDPDLPTETSLPETNVLAYIAGYLCFKVLRRHTSCQSFCKDKLVRQNALLDNPNLLFMYFKAYENGKDFGNLTVPTTAFINFIVTVDKIFVKTFNECYAEGGVKYRIETQICIKMHKLTRLLDLCEATIQGIITLYLRMRIHNVVKQYNKTLKGTKRKNRKYLKVCHY